VSIGCRQMEREGTIFNLSIFKRVCGNGNGFLTALITSIHFGVSVFIKCICEMIRFIYYSR